LILGGQNNEDSRKANHNIIIYDLEEKKITQTLLDLNLDFSFFTADFIANNSIFVYGGQCSDGKWNSNTYFINLETNWDILQENGDFKSVDGSKDNIEENKDIEINSDIHVPVVDNG